MTDHALTGPRNPLQWYVDAFRRYAEFGGRSRRSAFWWFVLVNWVVLLAVSVVVPTVGFLYWAVSLLPSVAVGVRRLHDTGRPGWWWLINLVPFGVIAFVVFMVLDGTREANRYGPDPKIGEAEVVNGSVCSACGTALDHETVFCGTCGAYR
ncbi:MAG: DUF805 domain-containing protein [Actinomycetota bacterium]|nr:DUF805 domain-containing protein [Actinomycetota bacterium]